MKTIRGFFERGLHFEVVLETGKEPRFRAEPNMRRAVLAEHCVTLALALRDRVNNRSGGELYTLRHGEFTQRSGAWSLMFFAGSERAQYGELRIKLQAGSKGVINDDDGARIRDSTIIGLLKALVAFAAGEKITVSGFAAYDTRRPALAEK